MWYAWERREKCTGFWVLVGKPEGKRPLGRQGVDGRIRPVWILGILAGEGGVGSVGSGQGLVAGFCECGDEPSGSGATELVGT
jgi:hypothetical protein